MHPNRNPAEQARSTTPARICQEPGCGKRLHSDNKTGYCWQHYYAKNRPSVERFCICKWTGCDNRLGSNNKSGYCWKHRQRKGTTRRHLTRAEKVLVDRLIAELCNQQTPGAELTAIINQKTGLNWPSTSYRQRARLRKQPWTPGKRRPPDIPLRELPICNYCGKVRMPVWYRIGSKAGRSLLCENRCCPDCGGKLEVHSKPKGGNWVHASPLPRRNCVVCGKEFQPNNIKRPHRKTCSDACTLHASQKNWRVAHPDKVREQNKEGELRRQAKVARGWRPDDWEQWNADQQAVGIILIEHPHIKPRALGIRLDDSRLPCIWQRDGGSWERNFAEPGTARNWLDRLIRRLEGNPLLTK